MKLLRTLSLVAATLTTGLMAGLFAAFSYAVMPGLAMTGDRAFVSAMQEINRAILNGWFMTSFMGAVVFAIAAAVLCWRGDRRALPWVIAGLVLYLVMFVITSAVNVPLNDRLDAAGNPGSITDLKAVRAAFEPQWVTWNLVRTVASVAAFCCFIGALVRRTVPDGS